MKTATINDLLLAVNLHFLPILLKCKFAKIQQFYRTLLMAAITAIAVVSVWLC
jgi:hypothetical protein